MSLSTIVKKAFNSPSNPPMVFIYCACGFVIIKGAVSRNWGRGNYGSNGEMTDLKSVW